MNCCDQKDLVIKVSFSFLGSIDSTLSHSLPLINKSNCHYIPSQILLHHFYLKDPHPEESRNLSVNLNWQTLSRLSTVPVHQLCMCWNSKVVVGFNCLFPHPLNKQRSFVFLLLSYVMCMCGTCLRMVPVYVV